MIETVKAGLQVTSEPEADDFWRAQDFEDQLEQGLRLLPSCFPGTRCVHLLLLEDADDEESRPRLVAELKSPLPRREFRAARMRFFEELHASGFERIYDLLTILQE